MSVIGDTWTLSNDFGYVYVSRSLLADESGNDKENVRKELEDNLSELEEKENLANGTYDSITKELENSKKTLSQKQHDLRSSESLLGKKVTELTKARDDLLSASNTVMENRQKLVNAQSQLTAVKKELENNKQQLITIQNTLNQLNSSINTLRTNRDILYDKETVLLVNLLRRLPGSMTIQNLKEAADYVGAMAEANPEVTIPIDIENTPLNRLGVLDDYADMVVDYYQTLKEIDIASLAEALKSDEELSSKYSEYIELIDSYVDVDAYDSIQAAYDAAYEQAGNYVNYVNIYRENQLTQYFSDSGIDVPVGELVDGFSNYDDVVKSMKEFFNFNDATTIKELLGMYDSAVSQSETTLNTLESERSKLLNQLHENGINENEINKNINLIEEQKEKCDVELANIKNAIKSIDNSSGDLKANLKQVTDGLSTLQKSINTGKAALYTASSDISNKEETFLSEWMDSTRQIKEAKEQIEQALQDVNNKYGYEDYFNRIVIKYTKGANEDEVLDTLNNRLAENGIDVLKTTPYENSLVNKRIQTAVEPVKKMSLFLPVIFFIIIVNVVFLFMNLIIKQCRRELGILKAIGYTTNKIRRSFYFISFLVYLLAIFMGSLIAYFLTRWLTKYYTDFFYLPVTVNTYNYKVFFIAAIVLLLVIELATYLATMSIKKLDAQEIISNRNPDYDLEPKVFNNLKLAPMLKYNVLTLFRNIKRFVFCCICIASSIILIFTSISAGKSAKYFQTELFEKRINYDAEVYMYDNVNDEFIEELKAQEFIEDVEVVSYYHEDIEFNGKKVDLAINIVDENTKMIKILDKKDKQIPIQGEGIILDHVTAKRLGVKKGDQVKIGNSMFDVNDISFQNIQFIGYLSKNEINKFNTNDVKVVRLNITKDSEQDLVNYLQTKDDYIYTLFTSKFHERIIKEFETMDFVTIIIISFSTILGFVIILNTNLTNLLEQKKKLCVLKSMGYNDSAISRNWFSQTIIQLVLACIIGFPLAIYISIKAVKYLSSVHGNYVFVHSINTYVLTLIFVAFYLIFSHLVSMRRMKNWDIAEEVKNRD